MRTNESECLAIVEGERTPTAPLLSDLHDRTRRATDATQWRRFIASSNLGEVVGPFEKIRDS